MARIKPETGADRPAPPSNDFTPQSAPELASMVLDLAAAVEAQEARIKASLLAAAEAGDIPYIRKLLRIWADGPVSEAMAQLSGKPRVSHETTRAS